jgi:formate hydrogenlyase transcriptional activator
LPLISRDRVLGVLVLDRRKEPVFLQQEINFVRQIANQLAIAIENALAYAEMRVP